MKRLTFTLFTLLLCIYAMAQVTLTINPKQLGPEIGKLHYGIFYEEINHAGDGGLYAELIRNRSFEDSSVPESWTSSQGAEMEITNLKLLNSIQKNALSVRMVDGGVVQNYGFWGMKFVEGEKYKFSAFVRSEDYNGNLSAELIDNNGNTIGAADVMLSANRLWVKVTATITATGNATRGSFVLKGKSIGNFVIDVVSLFPPTYKDRENGCRPDLAQMLADMKPAFMRFPGGCFIEGEDTNGSHNRFEWKKTIGPIEERPGHLNVNWRYRVTDGLGFHELLQLSEDLGAAPLFVVNVGIGHGWHQDVNDLDEFIQEALDALEYANGSTTTKYGAMRAANGHPEPFNLKLIEIGNENYQAKESEQSMQYAERYYKFYQAIKSQYPDVVCIGNVESWGTDSPTWRNSYPVDAVDEHYYRNPKWFENAYEKYDSYDRNTMPKVYAGEYAVTSAFGTTGNLDAALGEAVYMLGMENNSDMCVMSSYAPIFTHESDFNWKPDMIRFNSAESYGTPSYYVQKLMPNYVGTQNVKFTEHGNNREVYNTYVGLSTWLTSAEFSNYKITLYDGTVITPDFSGNSGWESQGGTWRENNGVLTQSNTQMQGMMYYDSSITTGDNYTIELDAKKTGGQEGFLIAFNVKDAKNYCWWNLGGWNNTQHAVEICTNGVKSTVTNTLDYLETGRTYHLKIEVNGAKVNCYMDGNKVFSFKLPKARKVYVASSINEAENKLYVKLVNTTGTAQNTLINLTDYKTKGGKLVQLASGSYEDENTNDNHYKVVPTEEALNVKGSSFLFNVQPYSLNIFVLDIEEGENTNSIYVDPQMCYLYNEEMDAYLSRGSDWGTRATFDKYGVPVELINVSEGLYNIRFLDNTSAACYLGKDVQPYTDKNSTFPISWTFILKENGGMALQNVQTKEYLMAGEQIGAGASFTNDINKSASLYIISAENQINHLKSRNQSIETLFDKCLASDVTEEYVINRNMAESINGWKTSFSKSTAVSNGLMELYEGYGQFSQTITGLTPNTYYRFSIPAFYRSASFTLMNACKNEGFLVSNAFIFAGNSEKQILPWVVDSRYPDYPNTMAQAAECFNEGKYVNSVIGKSDANGTLNIGLCEPQRNPSGWLIWGPVRLEKLTPPEDYTSKVNNPSFENGLYGWVNNMQPQTNSEPNAMKDGTTYCEKWTQAPNSLSNVFVRQEITNLPLGRYHIVAACHAENQSTHELITGTYLFANDDIVSVGSPADYEVYTDVLDGTLTIGYKTENTNANWVTVDNFRLYYLGMVDNDVDEQLLAKVRESLQNEMNKLQFIKDCKTILTDELRNEASDVLLRAGNTVTLQEMKDAITEVQECYIKLQEYRINVKRNDPYTSYVFAYFPSNSNENLYLAHSVDGFNYTALNNGMRVMASDTVAVKHGIRDPHILRGVDGKTFYMVATDMKCSEGWDSNRGFVMYKSSDLIHWQHSTVHFPTRFPDTWGGVTRVWAPEVIWNPDYVNPNGTKGRYMIYFSLLTNDGKCTYDKVFYCHANDDFTDLVEEPVFLYDRGSATIDADIIYDECDEMYHMIYKNEGSGGICHITAKTLTAPEGTVPGSQWGKPSGTIQQTNVAVEGGGLFRLNNSNKWVVMYDCYNNGFYQFCTTEDWKTYTFIQNTYTTGAFTPRHGTVLPITTAEAKALLNAFPTDGYNPVLSHLKGDVNDDGRITLEDANMVLNYTKGSISKAFVEENADVNNDKQIDIKDADEIINIFLGM